MKYKAGDKVRVRQAAPMIDEFGVTCSGAIKTDFFSVDKNKQTWCGKVLTIERVFDAYYRVKQNHYYWTDDMLGGYAFEWGEEIEVSNSMSGGAGWRRAKFFTYIDGGKVKQNYPYRVFYERERDSYNGCFKYARPIQNQKHSADLDTIRQDIKDAQERLDKAQEKLKELEEIKT